MYMYEETYLFYLNFSEILAGRLFRFSSVDHCMSEKIWIDNQIVHLNFFQAGNYSLQLGDYYINEQKQDLINFAF